MMENKMKDSLEHRILDVVNNRIDTVNINKDICAVIRPNRIQFIKKEFSESFHDYIDSIPQQKSKKTLSLTLVPTSDCNLSCIYCYSKGGEFDKSMNPSVAISFIEYMYNPKTHEKIHIRFAGGGEPFLNFDCMKKSVERAKELTKNISLHCITNGTFNEEQLQWMLDNHSQVRISFDGLSQKQHRPFYNGLDSSQHVRENIYKSVNKGLDVITQTTITSINVNQMKEIAEDIVSLGVKTIKLEPVYITPNSRGNLDLNVRPVDFAQNFIKTIRNLKNKNLDIKIDTAFFSRPTLGHYCSMAEGNLILTPEGYISGCVEITNSCDSFSDFIFYGKFNEKENKVEIDKDKLNKYKQFHFVNDSSCSACNLKLLCRGGCPMRSIWNQKKEMCQTTKILIPEILKLFYENKTYISMFKK